LKIPTEKHIETYVLNRSELTEKEQQWIRDWIEKDAEVRLLTEWFEKYYSELDEITTQKDQPDDIPPVIELKPLQNKRSYSSGVFVLAAQTPVTGRRRKHLKTIRTFVSEEYKTLIRILHDSKKNLSRLHVISEFVQEHDIVLIEVNDSNQTLMVSEPGGTFVIPDQEFTKDSIQDWNECELHLPIMKVRVYKDSGTGVLNFDTTGTNIERDKLRIEVSENELNLEFEGLDEKMPDKLVIFADQKSSIWPIVNGNCSIAQDKLSATETRLFFYK
jgi:hypothetical protein